QAKGLIGVSGALLLESRAFGGGLGRFAMHRLAVIAGTTAILIANQSQAQTRNNLLRGLSKINLVIENLDADSKECGLTEQGIRAAVMYPLSSARVEVAPTALTSLYVNVNTLYFSSLDSCVSSIEVRVHVYQAVTLDFSGEEKPAEVKLWRSGS